ncbi:MAG: PIN domain-containing protein [Acidobacteria bacterium]|nr:MAG: PIN domain-containing protein [Acidobacteriota bacterium]
MPKRRRDVAVLVDTGPIVAIIDRGQAEHELCLQTVRAIRCPLLTVWPVITEAMYLLSFSPRGQDALWEMILGHTLRLAELTKEDAPRMRQLMRRYADLPMDLADAALVRVAERENLRTIFTLDRTDFLIYRPSHIRTFRLLPP